MSHFMTHVTLKTIFILFVNTAETALKYSLDIFISITLSMEEL
jgi:hypothetical protein